MQNLPVELIVAIIRESLHDNPTTAKSISLVCRDFRHIGQEAAFRRLKILIPTPNDTAPIISKLQGLISHPLLLSHVTELDLEVLENEENCIPWMTQHVALLQNVLVLAAQSGKPLQALSISAQYGFRCWKFDSQEGQTQGSEFHKKLYEMVSLPTIQSLNLIGLPSIIIHRRLPALKHLTTRYLSRSDQYGFSKEPTVQVGNFGGGKLPEEGMTQTDAAAAVLDTLSIQSSLAGSGGHGWDVFDYLADAANTNILLHSLTELSILCLRAQWDCARRILDKCRSSLEALTFKCYRELCFSLSLGEPGNVVLFRFC
jgi:hypothetical protein